MNRGGNGKGATGGLGSIPAASREVVQSLKEIVNCPEAEIYAMLRECNMNPDEAVDRLLTQDSFREVKSKRDKKKENKETAEFRSRGTGNGSNRGGRSGTDRRTGSTQYNYSESRNLHERPAYRKENGSNSHIVPNSSVSLAANIDVNRHVSAFSEDVPKESKLTTASDSFSSPFPTSYGFQSAWGGGTAGQMSMADIVKKGKPQNKAPGPVNKDQYSNHNHSMTAPPPVLPHHAMSGSEPEVGLNQHKDEWPAIEHPPASTLLSVHGIENLGTTNLHIDGVSQIIKSDDAPLSKDGTYANENHGVTTTTNISFQENNFSNASYYDNNVYDDPSSYQQYGEYEEAEDNSTSLSNVAASMQQLSLEKDDHVQQVKEETCTVVIPDHLQVQSSECLNLTFGSFGAGIAASLAGTSTADPLNSDLEEQSETEDASAVDHSDFRNPEYQGDGQSRSISPENLINRGGDTAETHESISPSQPELLKQDIPSGAEGAHYTYHNLLPGYSLNDSHRQQLNPAFAQSQTNSQTQNPTPFLNAMAYTNLSPGALLASSAPEPVRESDLYSQFQANQLMAMAAKFGNAASVVGSSASGAEPLETSNVSSSPQVLTNANVAGPGLPQHLAMHPYSQPTLPLGPPFSNMISYPFLPQSYTYMPSSFQQAFNGNSSYHQSLAAVLPQYKNNVSVNSLPQSGAVPSGYGALGGSSINIPGNFSLNQNTAPGGSAIGYDELMSSHYKEQLLALQQVQLQNENSAMFAHGNSRTMSAVPANTFYNFQGQNHQQPGVFRQNQQQQPSQQFGSLGYPNYYHSQTGMSMEHQQQNSRDGSISGSQQVQPPKQSQQQMWHNGY
ncbi:unnamed protein product [Rhodiola kirilowii]